MPLKEFLMARKTAYGRHILSAGEIGAYTVCPEAWRLKVVENHRPVQSGSVKTGEQLHQVWAKDLDEFVYLNRTGKLIVLLIILAVVIAMMS